MYVVKYANTANQRMYSCVAVRKLQSDYAHLFRLALCVSDNLAQSHADLTGPTRGERAGERVIAAMASEICLLYHFRITHIFRAE